jgi:hypothetical protein
MTNVPHQSKYYKRGEEHSIVVHVVNQIEITLDALVELPQPGIKEWLDT